MALSGSFTHYSYTDHETDTIENSITYPADLPADDLNYDKRGTTETHQDPVQVEVTSSYEGVYVFVKAAALTTIDVTEGNNNVNINSIYRIYNSKAEKDADIDSHIAEYRYDTEWDWDVDSNPHVRAYSYIKSLPGGSGLSDI